MKKYIGVKMIDAEPMNLGEYNKFRGWEIPSDEIPEKEGYRVVYPDGYVSWSPKEVFEEAYRLRTGIPYGLAIEAMRKGNCIARTGWNGKDMFVCKQIPAVIDSTVIPKVQSLPDSAKKLLLDTSLEPIRYSNQMIIVKNNKTGDRIIDSWVASSSDTFADDWFIIE